MTEQSRKICFVVNPISGANRKPEKIVGWINEIFKNSSHETAIVYTRCAGDATRLAAEAEANQFDMVVAVGGDGTVNEMGRALVGSQVILGVVPAGSGNGFARNFGIPLNQYRAIKLLKNAGCRTIDVGKLNSHFFFNVAGSGLDAEISRKFENFGQRGPLPYFLTGVRAFLQYRPKPLKLHFETETIEISPMLLSLANAPQYGNGAIIAPSAVPDDGFLDLTVLNSISLWRALPNIYRLFNGTIDRISAFRAYRFQKMVIERSEAGTIHTDGNPHQEEAVLEIETIPAALKVAVAPESPGE